MSPRRTRVRAALVPLSMVAVMGLVGITLVGGWPRSLLADSSASPDGAITDRPYTDDSAWNTPIAPGAPVDPRSDGMVSTILAGSDLEGITSDSTQYSFPVYEAAADTPRHDLPCLWYKCTVVDPADPENPDRVEVLPDVPIPDDARPSPGSDGSMIIIDLDTGTEYDLWMVRRQIDGSWSVANGSVYNINWDGVPVVYGSRGAGLPYLAGLIRHAEIAAGRIDHAIAFAYPTVAADGCVWPASKTDGTSTDPDAIPEGARLQLDPALTDADFEAWGLDRTGLIIARALQQYGMILVDVSGRPKIVVEDVAINPYADASWNDPATLLDDQVISAIPITSFSVLALPAGYNFLAADGPRHGDCYR